MADHIPDAPIETGAKMDYSQHEKTYSMFLALTKYVGLHCITLLIAMAFGFFTSAGFLSATILFLLLSAIGVYLLK